MKKNEKEIFPYGVHFYREPPRPMIELKKDIRIVKKLGFNMLKIQESWAIDEPEEGEIDLSKIEEIISEARKLDLLIYFGVTMEQAPAWLWKKYPDCRLVYNTGEPHNDPTQYLLPADGKPGPCWFHPGARESAERFITTLVQKLSRYENIICWNVWQEIGFWPMKTDSLGFCYCPSTLSKFREWLREKYKDISALNNTWRTAYGNWEEIEPPRFFPAVPSWIDWRYFMDDVYLPYVLRWKKECIKKNDPEKRPIFAHVGSPIIGSGAEWYFSKELDIFGSSCYPAWGTFQSWDKDCPEKGELISKDSVFQEIINIALKFDYARCACTENCQCWAAEFQGGPVVTFLQKGRTPSPEDIQRWVLTALSSGIQGLSFWNHRAEIFWNEAYGFGLLDSKGNSSLRAQEAGKIGRAINKYSPLFSKGRVPQSEIAIFINEDSRHFLEATSTESGSAFYHLTHTIRGIHKLFWSSGIWADFIEVSQTEKLKNYKVLILPFPLAISEDLMENFKDYVKKGGILISEACPGRYDKYGLTRNSEISEIAQEIFGVEHKDLFLCQEPGKPRWTPRERSYGEILPATRFSGTGKFKGDSVLANFYAETFSIGKALPILLKGKEITGVENSYGKGKAYLIGTFLGHSIATYEDEPTAKFILKLLEQNGILPEKCGRLLRRRRILDNSEAWFLINPTPEKISEKLNFSNFKKVEDLLGDKLSEDTHKNIEVPGFSIRVFVLQKGG